jgi:hypothetical protein
MVSFTVNPAGQAHGLFDIGLGKLATGVAAEFVHFCKALRFKDESSSNQVE